MIRLDGSLTIDDVVAVARGGEAVELAPAAADEMAASREVVEDIVDSEDRHVYGVNTGLGDLQNVSISRDALVEMQRNVVASHAATVGDPADAEVVRATMLARANALATGRSGVRPIVVERLCEMLNARVHPRMPLSGSSDDLAAVAHVALVLAGGGEAEYDGETVDGEMALASAGLDPLTLQPKEGLSLISGTPVMTGLAALAVADARRLVRAADAVGALTFALIGEAPETFTERVNDVRPHDGHAATARNVRAMLPVNPEETPRMTQDPLSLRVIPQVHGTAREHVELATDTVETELASATGNPLVFPDGEVYSCGTFNGQPVASAADTAAATISKLGSISESRTRNLLEGDDDVAAFLAGDPGLETGLMIAHYTSAGLVAETRSDGISDRSITVSAGQEDIHSMGTVAARNLRATVERTRQVLAIELLCAVRFHQLAVDADRDDAVRGSPLEHLLDGLHERVDVPLSDAALSDVIEDTAAFIADGGVEETLGGTGVELD